MLGLLSKCRGLLPSSLPSQPCFSLPSLPCSPSLLSSLPPLSATFSTSTTLERSRRKGKVRCGAYDSDGLSPRAGVVMHKHKPAQEWYEWDGFGPYKYRHHHYPRNITLRDVQRRRIFKEHHRERTLLRSVYKNDLLPKELQEGARNKVVWELPLDSDHWRPNFRCVVTGRARGNHQDFRVSRFIFRAEADHNRVSGVQRAHWTHNSKIDP